MSAGADRAALIDSILEARCEWGGGVGVYGGDVCALCGRVDTFRGWIMAAYGCHFGPHNEFVCESCRDRLIPRDQSGISERNRLVGAVLRQSDRRFCRLCERQIRRRPDWEVKRGPIPRICDACREALSEEGIRGEDEIVDSIRLRVRRRFLELLNHSELEAMSGLVDDMRIELDSQRQARAGAQSGGDDPEGSTELLGQIGVYPDPAPRPRR